jgi:hypothetical protein
MQATSNPGCVQRSRKRDEVPVLMPTGYAGGTESLHLIPAFSGLVNRYLYQFVTSLEEEWKTTGRPPAPAPTKKVSEILKPALEFVATLQGDPKIKKREAKSIWSFCRAPAEGVAGMEQL